MPGAKRLGTTLEGAATSVAEAPVSQLVAPRPDGCSTAKSSVVALTDAAQGRQLVGLLVALPHSRVADAAKDGSATTTPRPRAGAQTSIQLPLPRTVARRPRCKGATPLRPPAPQDTVKEGVATVQRVEPRLLATPHPLCSAVAGVPTAHLTSFPTQGLEALAVLVGPGQGLPTARQSPLPRTPVPLAGAAAPPPQTVVARPTHGAITSSKGLTRRP